MRRAAAGAFRALANPNYRLWAVGALVSNVGTWMQRTAQDWLVLTELTRGNAVAVGIVMALQFGPQVVLLPWTGFAADHFDRRRLLIATQAAMGLLALGLGLLTLTGVATLWQVYAFSLLLGCVGAFDTPARQTFVTELVGEMDLSNAVALNSTSFNAGRLIGPAIAGLLIAVVGTGWVFLINAGSFLAVLFVLMRLRADALHPSERPPAAHGQLAEGFRYVWARPDLGILLLMSFLIGTFGLNFPIFVSTMSVSVFHMGAGGYGLLSSAMAAGSVAGALLSAQRGDPQLMLVSIAAAIFGLGCAMAALVPGDGPLGLVLFGASLVVTAIAGQTFTTSSNSLVQLSTDPVMRGRVIAILLALAFGGTPIGAPIVGWVADRFGPRWALAVGAASGLAAALFGILRVVRVRSERELRPP